MTRQQDEANPGVSTAGDGDGDGDDQDFSEEVSEEGGSAEGVREEEEEEEEQEQEQGEDGNAEGGAASAAGAATAQERQGPVAPLFSFPPGPRVHRTEAEESLQVRKSTAFVFMNPSAVVRSRCVQPRPSVFLMYMGIRFVVLPVGHNILSGGVLVQSHASKSLSGMLCLPRPYVYNISSQKAMYGLCVLLPHLGFSLEALVVCAHHYFRSSVSHHAHAPFLLTGPYRYSRPACNATRQEVHHAPAQQHPYNPPTPTPGRRIQVSKQQCVDNTRLWRHLSSCCFRKFLNAGGAPDAAAAGEVSHRGQGVRRADSVFGLLLRERGKGTTRDGVVGVVILCAVFADLCA